MPATPGTRGGGTGLGSVAVALIVIGLMLAVDGFRAHHYAPPPVPPPAAAGPVGLTRQTSPAAPAGEAAQGQAMAGPAVQPNPVQPNPVQPNPVQTGPVQTASPVPAGTGSGPGSASGSGPGSGSGSGSGQQDPPGGTGTTGDPVQPGGPMLPGAPAQPGGPMRPGPVASAAAPAFPAGAVLPGAPMLAVQPATVSSDRPAARSDKPAGPALPYSRPVLLAIPAIGVRARIIALGANRNGSARVPPLAKPFLVSWFDKGAAPGQRGTADLFGHVDSRFSGPAVFYKLGLLRPGDCVTVTRADHRVAVFRIYSVRIFPKDRFPAAWIYGATGRAELRLVTCGGPFNDRTRDYLDNTVAFARLATVRTS